MRTRAELAVEALLNQLTACQQECAKLQAQSDQLIKERDAALRQIDSLQKTHVRTNQSGATAGASASSENEDPTSRGSPPSRLKCLRDVLAVSEAAVQACLPDSDSAVDFEQASEEELREMREIRGHAALLAMLGMTLMEAYYNALPQSMIRRVHAAAWRPRKAGGADPSADAMVPAISRLLFRSLSLQLLLAVADWSGVWIFGAL